MVYKLPTVLKVIILGVFAFVIATMVLPEVVSATPGNESIDMITFPAGELEYKGFVYSSDMCNALDCYRAYEMML